MKGFATSPNPFLTGMRPRAFFAERLAMLRKEQMMKKVDKDHYPKWQEEKKTKI